MIKDWLLFILQDINKTTQENLLDLLESINTNFLFEKLKFERDNVIITINNLINQKRIFRDENHLFFNPQSKNKWWIRLPNQTPDQMLSVETIMNIKKYLQNFRVEN